MTLLDELDLIATLVSKDSAEPKGPDDLATRNVPGADALGRKTAQSRKARMTHDHRDRSGARHLVERQRRAERPG